MDNKKIELIEKIRDDIFGIFASNNITAEELFEVDQSLNDIENYFDDIIQKEKISG